jgi:2,4-dienoyl-CoA reductase-like NADH-dependent reductase (Old Yellow Enzyme family)
MPDLFSPYSLKGVTLRNRIAVSPMTMYRSVDGLMNDFHVMMLGARAAGGFGLVIAEATAVVPEGRITPQDTGLWNDAQVDAWRRITDVIHANGSLAGVQLAHAGRKASTYRPWDARRGTVPADDGGWTAVAPSAIPFPGMATPAALTDAQLRDVPRQFAAAAGRALAAGFDVVEIHAAHGYLLHELLSPLSNERTDEYGGPLENRARLLVEVVDAVRGVWPQDRPLLVRFSATDWADGGLTVEEVTAVAKDLGGHGVDLVDVSTGGNVPADIPVGPGYLVPAARAVRAGSGLPVAAVGLIESPQQAEQVLFDGAADVVLIGRAALREPSWPLRAAHDLGVPVDDAPWPAQYRRGTWA